jgi:hypothetical protein
MHVIKVTTQRQHGGRRVHHATRVRLGFDRGRVTVTEKDLLGGAIRDQGASIGLRQSVIGTLEQQV